MSTALCSQVKRVSRYIRDSRLPNGKTLVIPGMVAIVVFLCLHQTTHTVHSDLCIDRHARDTPHKVSCWIRSRIIQTTARKVEI